MDKKIIIYTHYCTEEEYEALLEYLDMACWDYKEEENDED